MLDQFVHPHKRVKLGKSYLYFSFGKSPFCSYRFFFNCTRNTFGSGGNPQIFTAVTVPQGLGMYIKVSRKPKVWGLDGGGLRNAVVVVVVVVRRSTTV